MRVYNDSYLVGMIPVHGTRRYIVEEHEFETPKGSMIKWCLMDCLSLIVIYI